MADLTEVEIQAMISAINTKLLNMIANPTPDYKLGEETMTWSRYHDMLLKQLKLYREMATELPAEEITIWREW